MKQFQFKKIKEFREAAGVKQAELAGKIGVPARQLWEWEHRSDDRSLTTLYLGKLADALGKRTDDFFIET